MGMPAERTRRWTAREVRQLIAAAPHATPRYELVDGELLVTPGPSLRHQMAVKLLLLSLSDYIEQAGVAAEAFASPSDVELEPEDIRQPDVFVIPRAEWQRAGRGGGPVREVMVAVEVLSPFSSRHDRVTKRPGYQRHVAEYWIVDLESRLVERWRPADERPEILTAHVEWLAPGTVTPFRLDLLAMFARVFDEERP